ncbi:MAG: N-acyl amino acid synthase of PEP-CTERM/exosortase system [Phenylobacterium sp.]|jgi:N-acyl amino acid synthase of PEP-CTERM/exosortase system
MTTQAIAAQFNQLFNIQFADTHSLKQSAYKIRHAVYCAELGWEPEQPSQMESDQFDDYAWHCLFRDRSSGEYIGSVRLIIPAANRPKQVLPFEKYYQNSIRTDIVKPMPLSHGRFGEISRLAVLPSFRRRLAEQQDCRKLPDIAIGLYLGMIALGELCQLNGAYVLMEPRLQRRLRRMGLAFEQIGDEIDHNGTQAMFYLPKEKFSSGLSDELKALYELIYHDLSEQINQDMALPLGS